MPLECTKLPISGDDAYLGAIGYLAILAWPNAIESRNKFVDCCNAWWCQRHIEAGGDDSWVPPRYRKHQYPTRRIYDTGPAVKAWRLITSRRLPAARVAEKYLLTRWTAGDKKTGTGISALFGNDVNKVTRIWSESKPVLHLAIALRQQAELPSADIFDLLANPGWLRTAVETAEKQRNLLCLHPHLAFSDQQTIQVIPS